MIRVPSLYRKDAFFSAWKKNRTPSLPSSSSSSSSRPLLLLLVTMACPLGHVLGLAGTEHPPGSRTGAAVPLEGDHAVHDGVVVALGPADPAPLAPGEVVGDLLVHDAEALHVVDDHVRRHPHGDGAAIEHPRGGGRVLPQAPV